ncbi:MAG TPA: ATP-binding protein [Planctomycetota bacterium]|nr:ATP-binding protein [Planctomycetota bacterium]
MSLRSVALRSGELRPHKPFDLITLLARSQTDPRKAVSELVQNSLDARAKRISVTRVRERGSVALRIVDDGEGVLPDLGRQEALEYLAVNIGHSRKHKLTIEERHALGQYGIGLLGFWAVGEELELRTRLRGEQPLALRLREGEARYTIEEVELSKPTGEDDPLSEAACTEVVIRRIHAGALSLLAGRRLSDYLSAELRDQVRSQGTRIVVHDGLARGRAARLFRVEPGEIDGVPLDLPSALAVENHPPARLDLRALPEGRRGAVALVCRGAVVSDDIAREPSLGLDHAPWNDPRLSGRVVFSAISPAPASRRGIVPNREAEALRVALVEVEDLVKAALAQIRSAPARELERESLERLRRAFVNLARELPRYELLEVGSTAGSSDNDRAKTTGGVTGTNTIEPGKSDDTEATTFEPEPGDPNDLATLRLVPTSLRVPPGGTRAIRAIGYDGNGRPIASELSFGWAVADPSLVTLQTLEDGRAKVVAGDRDGETTLRAIATSTNGRDVSVEGSVLVLTPPPQTRSGVPDPLLVDDGSGSWRTRVREGSWEVNAGHRDYQLVKDHPDRRLNYLVLLLAKEVVQRNEGGDVRIVAALESLAEVAAFALRQV